MSRELDRDPMTGEYIDAEADRHVDWSEDPMLGRWTRPEAPK